MKIDPYCHQRICSLSKCTFQQCIDCVDIAGRSSARRRQTRVVLEMSCFRAKCVNISKTVGDTSEVTINH